MYRPKYRNRKTPHDVKPWDYAAKLRKSKLPSAVHALAYLDIKAYHYILTELKNNTSLELIMNGLSRDYARPLKMMRQLGYGGLSPNSLLTFKRNYWDKNRAPDIEAERANQIKAMEPMIEMLQTLDKSHDKIAVFERRVGIHTKLGLDLLTQCHETANKILELKIKLGIVKPRI